MPSVNEWTLTADVAKWIADVLRERPELPFSEAKVEERGRGSRKRRDLTIYDRKGNLVITGEIKMPDNSDGRSPFQDSLVKDAHEKADTVGAEYFFTWNVNRCVLWRTFEQGVPITERHIHHWYVLPAPVRDSADVAHPRVEEQVARFLSLFLERCAAIMTGAEALPSLPLDEKFLLVWEAALDQPVAQTLRSLSGRYLRDREFTTELDRWMRDKQGWTVSSAEEHVRDNLERAAKFACYVLANKIIFYKALRRRFRRMKSLRIPQDAETGAELEQLLSGYFDHAAQVSKDYETVFHGDFGDTLPFLNDSAVHSWRDLVVQTDGFDFTLLDYEIIGQVFERMLSSNERHKFGQHYTRSEVVDLINAFCIRTGSDKVFDPACGGGTFLVRAYTRKRDLSEGKLKHRELIRQLYGTDISAYPVHLTTINLATRDLIDEANYPLVARTDFFAVDVGAPIFHLPMGSADKQYVNLQIEKVDAVVGNPPYIRQERITEYYGKKYKERLRAQADREARGTPLSGRSDIHCYFFTHGATFLDDGGYLGLLTSSTWLDTAYGFRLQEYLLDNFEIVAIFESNCEPWFSGARVTTAAAILRKQSDPRKRTANNVKFVWLTQPISDLLAYSPEEHERRLTFEHLRDRIEGMCGSEEFTLSLSGVESVSVGQETLRGMRVRVVNQGELRRLGCSSLEISENDEESGAEPNGNGEIDVEVEGKRSEYAGYKWGLFLRAPDIYFKLLRRGEGRFVPLGTPEIAEVKRGITSGCDAFFFPRDVTDQALLATPDPKRFKEDYGISPRSTDHIRIVQAGDGSQHLIEAEYLEPVVFNLMEVDSAEVDADRLRRRVLLVSKPKRELRGKHVLKYIRWGEREGFHHRSTCASRANWYNLGDRRRSWMLWTMAQRYRHIVPLNPAHLLCNHNLFDVSPTEGVRGSLLAAVLNSSIVALFKHQFGRMMGGDPVLKTEVVDVKMMLVPDPRLASEDVSRRLQMALNSMRGRQIGHLVDVDSQEEGPTGELAMPDRRELDDAVLELIGIADPAERIALREELYAEITRLYRNIRMAEKRMQKFRSESARRGRPTARSLAQEIWESIEEKPPHKTPLDFLRLEDVEEVDLPEGKAKIVHDLWNPSTVEVSGQFIPLEHPYRAELVKAISDVGIHGSVLIPGDPDECRRAILDYEAYIQQQTDEFLELAAAHTSDEQMQERIVRELWRLTRNSHAPAD